MLSHLLLGTENSLFHLIGEIFHPLFELFGLILAGLYAIWPNYGFAITGLTIIDLVLFTVTGVRASMMMIVRPVMEKP